MQGAGCHLAGNRFGCIARLERGDKQFGLNALVRVDKCGQGLVTLCRSLGGPAIGVMDGQTVFLADVRGGLRCRGGSTGKLTGQQEHQQNGQEND